jgi:hypothetical protein
VIVAAIAVLLCTRLRHAFALTAITLVLIWVDRGVDPYGTAVFMTAVARLTWVDRGIDPCATKHGLELREK